MQLCSLQRSVKTFVELIVLMTYKIFVESKVQRHAVNKLWNKDKCFVLYPIIMYNKDVIFKTRKPSKIRIELRKVYFNGTRYSHGYKPDFSVLRKWASK